MAGGLNLYGFADGDPVNFSDPFGLNPLLRAALALQNWWLGRGAPLAASIGAAMTGLSSPLAPGGGLAAHEARGGHTIGRHVAKGIIDLGNRLAREPNLKAASSFPSRAAAEKAVGAALDASSGEIAAWLGGAGGRKVIDYAASETVGYVLERGASLTSATSSLRLVLQRDAASATGYTIITAYPIK